MAKANTRLVGHGLLREGAAFGDSGKLLWLDGRWSGPGRGKCECDDLSPWLTSAAARKRWHAEHKADVRQRQAASGDGA